MEQFVENFYSFDFAGDLVVNDKDEEEIDFKTLNIENSNENDERDLELVFIRPARRKRKPMYYKKW